MDLYNESSEFRLMFEKPLTGNHSPSLVLKKGFLDFDTNKILSTIIDLAAKYPKPLDPGYFRENNRLLALKLIKLGLLFECAEFENNKVCLVVKPEYNSSQDFQFINADLVMLYKKNGEFRLYFDEPQAGTHQPFLILRQSQIQFTRESFLQALKYIANSDKRTFQETFKFGFEPQMPPQLFDSDQLLLFEPIDPDLLDDIDKLSDTEFEQLLKVHLSSPAQVNISYFRHCLEKKEIDSDTHSELATHTKLKKAKHCE